LDVQAAHHGRELRMMTGYRRQWQQLISPWSWCCCHHLQQRELFLMGSRPGHRDLVFQPIKQMFMRGLLPLKHVVERLAGQPTRHFALAPGTAANHFAFRTPIIATWNGCGMTYHLAWLVRTAQSYSFQTSFLRTRRFLIMVYASLIRSSIVPVDNIDVSMPG
jgi:hypothetical protein